MNKISHRSARKMIQARLSLALPTPKWEILNRHLSACPACQDYASQMQALETRLRQEPHGNRGNGPAPTSETTRIVLEKLKARQMKSRMYTIARVTVVSAVLLLLILLFSTPQGHALKQNTTQGLLRSFTRILGPIEIPPTMTGPVSEANPRTAPDVWFPSLDPGTPCPITPPQSIWAAIAPAAGEYPVWITSSGQMKYSNLGPRVLPSASGELRFVEGHLTKTLVVVDQSAEGDLRIVGRQLDGESRVYFPLHDQFTRIDEETLQLLGMPPDFVIVEDAHVRTRSPNPPGKAHTGIGPLYINPGCYQLTATIAEYTVSIVFEILDE